MILDGKGDIVTNAHVVEGATSLLVTLADGRRLPARLIGSYAPDDLAVITVGGGYGMPCPRQEPSCWVSAFRYCGAPICHGIEPASFIGLAGGAARPLVAGALPFERRDTQHYRSRRSVRTADDVAGPRRMPAVALDARVDPTKQRDLMAAVTDSATHEANRHPPKISRIAVGVDGFPEGNDAVVLGATLAQATQSELLLVAVHPDPLVVMPEEMNWKSLDRQAEAKLRETCDLFSPQARIAVETDLFVPRALERVVGREHRDLLVVGSSRRGPEGRVRIGKRTRQLLCHLRCALAIAPRGWHKGPERGLRRIGVGYDGGGESDAALALAGSLALVADAELRVCAVVDDRVPPIGWSALATGGAAAGRWEETVHAEMDALRDFGLSGARATGASAQVEVHRGRPADALLKLSAEVDLLVIGSRRWGPVARLLLGGTGEALAHHAACPLLVAPRPEGQDAGPWFADLNPGPLHG